ncbi:PLP-dependent aminotransferase family protein [Pedobacter faecalis]|uniref:MocR-like pyridoxine biosynthesis transcription factor PdxR n=1 Tax=Pedobacter faecalis TaxID=3041495 RepID=UPI002550019D|nr:PLP-dependent aminotransferase family protein [Pedobacter sp. ELA7]
MLRPWDLQIKINVDCERAVYIQIADAVIEAIKSGKLQAGAPLPGSRQLAAQLKLNRNTIVDALDVLLAEGWLISKERRGTFVADNLPGVHIAKPAQAVATVQEPGIKPEIVFDDGVPDTRIAPINELARAYRQIFNRKAKWQMMGYAERSGDSDFRDAIVQMLNYKRGMRLLPSEVYITRGSQMAMYLAAHCLLKPGDQVVVENPGYKPAWKAFASAGAELLPVGVDEDGLDVAAFKRILEQNTSVRAVYVTPHHQFPTTVTLSLSRRLELIALSNQYGFTIIEDDYDNEFHFGQRPVYPVSSFENARNFIYIGTMSKIVAPALRLGFMASSASLIEKVAELRKIIDAQGDNMMEQAILQLIGDGHIKRHLRRATLIYKEKRDYFEGLIIQYLGDKVTFRKPDGGLAFWMVPKGEVDLDGISRLLLQKGVEILSPDRFSFDEPVNGMRLGYASLSEKQLEEGIKVIASVLS